MFIQRSRRIRGKIIFISVNVEKQKPMTTQF